MAASNLLNPTDQLPYRAHNDRLHYQHSLSLEPRLEKRIKTTYNSQHFAKNDLLILELAADVLRVPLEGLLSVTHLIQPQIEPPTVKCMCISSASNASEQTRHIARSASPLPPMAPSSFASPNTMRSTDFMSWIISSSNDQMPNAGEISADLTSGEIPQPETTSSTVSGDSDLPIFDVGNHVEDSSLSPDTLYPLANYVLADYESIFHSKGDNWGDPLAEANTGPFLNIENKTIMTSQLAFPIPSNTGQVTTSPAGFYREQSHCQTTTSEISTLSFHPGMDNETPSLFIDPRRDQEGAAMVGKTNNLKRKRRGPFQDLEKREATSLTRKYGACISCKMQRIRVRKLTRNNLLKLANSVSVKEIRQSQTVTARLVFRQVKEECVGCLACGTISQMLNYLTTESAPGSHGQDDGRGWRLSISGTGHRRRSRLFASHKTLEQHHMMLKSESLYP